MKEIIESPFFIAIFLGLIAIGTAIWSRKNKSNDDVFEKIDKKVDKEDYNSFAKRIGREVDNQDIAIGKLEKGLAFVVGKLGGNYNEL